MNNNIITLDFINFTRLSRKTQDSNLFNSIVFKYEDNGEVVEKSFHGYAAFKIEREFNNVLVSQNTTHLKRLFSIIVLACDWGDTGWLSMYNSVPINSKVRLAYGNLSLVINTTKKDVVIQNIILDNSHFPNFNYYTTRLAEFSARIEKTEALLHKIKSDFVVAEQYFIEYCKAQDKKKG